MTATIRGVDCNHWNAKGVDFIQNAETNSIHYSFINVLINIQYLKKRLKISNFRRVILRFRWAPQRGCADLAKHQSGGGADVASVAPPPTFGQIWRCNPPPGTPLTLPSSVVNIPKVHVCIYFKIPSESFHITFP